MPVLRPGGTPGACMPRCRAARSSAWTVQWTERYARPECKAVGVHHVRNDGGVNREAGEHVTQEARRHHVQVGAAERAPRQRRSCQVVGSFAAAVVEDHGFGEQPRHADGRPGGQQERGVGRGKDVHDVRAPGVAGRAMASAAPGSPPSGRISRVGRAPAAPVARGFTGTSQASTSGSPRQWCSNRSACTA